jgi:hypothetical protein
MSISRRLLSRVIIWQNATGNILDIPASRLRGSEVPEVERETEPVTGGSALTTRRTHRAPFRLIETDEQELGALMRRVSCDCSMVAIGRPGTQHLRWSEPTRLALEDRTERRIAEKRLVLENSVYWPAIEVGPDLLAGIPWRGTDPVQASDGLYYLMDERDGYEGPLWNVPELMSPVDVTGALPDVEDAVLEMTLPAWSLEVALQVDDGHIVEGTIEALDWDGAVLASDSGGGSDPAPRLALPVHTWSVRITVEEASTRPQLVVTDVGTAQGPITGGTSADCSRVADPAWPSLTLTGEDV